MSEKEPKRSKKAANRVAREQSKHQERSAVKKLFKKVTELGLAGRLMLSALALGGTGATYLAYDYFVGQRTPNSLATVAVSPTLGIREQLNQIEADARTNKYDHFQTASRLGGLAINYVCQELQPEIPCNPEQLKRNLNIQTAEKYRITFNNRLNCSNVTSNDVPPAYTDTLNQQMYFDLGQLTRMPITSAWQGFVHEALHANTELKDLDTPTEVFGTLRGVKSAATKQRGLRAYVPDTEYNFNSRDCYRATPSWLEEAIVTETKGRMMKKIGLSNMESDEYLRVASNYTNIVVNQLFEGNHKVPLEFHQKSQAIPFYIEVGRRLTAKSTDQAYTNEEFQKLGEAYLHKSVLEGISN
jgi:hypothetical protein